MSEVSRIDQLLADLKRRFKSDDLTYAEAVMIEDLIAAVAEISAEQAAEDLGSSGDDAPVLPQSVLDAILRRKRP